MKVEKVIKKTTIEHEELIIKYNKSDIEELIRKDVAAHGYVANKIQFKTNWKYVGDEWGMNNSPVSYFTGVELDALEKEESDGL